MLESSKEFDKLFSKIRKRLRASNVEIENTEDAYTLDILTEFLASRQRKIYLFDYEDFNNLGDQALWTSLIRLLRLLPQKIKINGLLPNLALPYPDRLAGTTLIFPGGGSLGNRYTCSLRRARLIEKARPDSIIQMPVSTTFSETRPILSKARLGKAYSSTESLIFIRDSTSLKEAKFELSIDGTLARDLTSFLPTMEHLRIGGHGLLTLLRKDQEAAFQRPKKPNIGIVADWENVKEKSQTEIKIASAIFFLANSPLPPFQMKWRDAAAKIRLWAANRISEIHTARAMAFLALFDNLITDRLHGVLLARKVGLTVCAIDNDHGKLSRYLFTWEKESIERNGIKICANIEEAMNFLDL